MPFSSLNFLAILPCLLLVYWNLPARYKRLWLLFASFVVYMAAGWHDLILLVTVTSANWLTSRLAPASRRVPLAMVALDVLCLAWFKYRLFLASLVGIKASGGLIIPLGISFYIFQLISYQVELRKGVIRNPPTFFSFFLYIFFFPHHQAGPIMRPHTFLGAFQKGRNWVGVRFRIGVLMVLWGLFKKIWIADFLMGHLVRDGFQQLHASDGRIGNALLLAVGYGVQIYMDFSGYSDIAVGLGRMFGFNLTRNFHQPYLASGPSEFWRRWHVTLSQWLRDHLYIPLGGNRKGAARTQLNLMLVMVIGGMWHGAGWCFLLWGFLHGLYLILERAADPVLRRVPAVKMALFQLLFMLAWIPFREPNLSAVWHLFSRASAWTGPATVSALAMMLAVMLFSALEDWIERHFPRLLRRIGGCEQHLFALATACSLFVVLLGVRHETMFIYQRF
jgi:alginate O-acetyltransferase complex protein AlgI